jgi:hypothetical protein
LSADGDLELTVQDVKDFRFVAMNVKRRAVSGRDLLLQDGIRPARFSAQHFERALVAKHPDDFTFSGPTDDRDRRFRLGKKIHLVSHRRDRIRLLHPTHYALTARHCRA